MAIKRIDDFDPIVGVTEFSVMVTKSVLQSLGSDTDIPVTWDLETFDNGGLHDTAVNNERITVPAGGAGRYFFLFLVNFGNLATGFRRTRLRKNGATFFATATHDPVQGGVGTAFVISGIQDLIVGDYVECTARRGGITAVNVDTSDCFFMAFRI